ncbi:MAG: YicC family protein [Clostridia bacterium]|nr:YicC family protein [Clostridia bacterium]
MLSMTGYGRAEYQENGIELVVEIKTVNNRNLDLNLKMPRSFIAIEDAVRKTVQKHVSRARVDVFVTFTDKRESENGIEVNLEKAISLYKASELIAKTLAIENDYSVSSIMRNNDVISENSVEDVTSLQEIITNTVNQACIKLNEMRKVEGEKLVADLLNRMQTIEGLRQSIALRAPKLAEEYKIKLKARIEEALKDVKYDESRLLTEVAIFTDKVNIDEELTRLNSHISQFKEIIKIAGMGKKLDFLMQEFNRETNTICSKSNDIEITGYALSLKNEIEKVREQVQNLE